MGQDKGSNVPRIIEGESVTDDRGEVGFVNDFHFEGVKRFYLVSNHKAGFVRAWHAHRREAKYATVVQGAAIVAAVLIDDWERPSKDAKAYRFVLSARKPSMLYIPPGYANGFMSLTPDCKILFLSTATLEESQSDDVRYDARYWDVWQVVER
jgi:dTDP-4-dehydrorhamnose 3,5-epimerase